MIQGRDEWAEQRRAYLQMGQQSMREKAWTRWFIVLWGICFAVWVALMAGVVFIGYKVGLHFGIW